jgi:hypothetical protein
LSRAIHETNSKTFLEALLVFDGEGCGARDCEAKAQHVDGMRPVSIQPHANDGLSFLLAILGIYGDHAQADTSISYDHAFNKSLTVLHQ